MDVALGVAIDDDAVLRELLLDEDDLDGGRLGLGLGLGSGVRVRALGVGVGAGVVLPRLPAIHQMCETVSIAATW